MNPVSVDDAAIQAELAQIGAANDPVGAAAQGAPSEASADTAPAQPADWTVPAGGIVLVLDRVIMPNWELEAEEKGLLHEQIKTSLEVFFPNTNMDPRIAALLAIGGTLAVIGMKRIDPDTKKLKPLRKPKPKPADDEHADGSEPENDAIRAAA